MERRRIRVRGTVQGVGFRPFVYRHAQRLGLAGWVLNDSRGVLIEAEGTPAALDELARAIAAEPPRLARVESVETSPLAACGESGFRIVASPGGGTAAVPVSPDTATCDACLAELFDPADRRYRYPFINCTDCGPRYTIVLSVPYDRPATTMAGFAMCARCRAEYDDPADRRFHAQPNACPECGPRLAWSGPDGRVVATGEEALAATIQALAAGGIVAVKGVGGYHLAVDATDEPAVGELRRRKARDDKPFAVMVASISEACRLCDLDRAAIEVLSGTARPIVLAPRRRGAAVAASVAPGLAELGLMLPYAPLHHLLLAGAARPLVMTSGNLTDEPIAHEDADAVTRLGPLVDGICSHDRPIHVRCDDSVVRALPAGPQVLRRSRGWTPAPLALPVPAARHVLAVGAMLKNTVSVAKERMVVPSHHIGDLEHLATYRSFLQAVEHLPRLYGVEPEVVAHDLHPEYLSTKFALDADAEPCGVQHHHAHVASCLVEHGRTEPVVGVAFDGLGFGADGTLWGGEVLVAGLAGFERAAHLLAVPMPGGAAAVRNPWRMALSWANAAGGADLAAQVGERLDPAWEAVAGLVASGRSPMTTSAGRLFDAVAALLGVRATVTYEGQAAIELEALAASAARRGAGICPFTVDRSGPLPVLDPRPAVRHVAGAALRGEDRAEAALAFHRGLAAATAELAGEVAAARGLDTVALSGGVFQNALLSGLAVEALEKAGLRVLTHRLVPPNDGGISVGQAAVAAARTA
ncbi:MAG TPA: carbamoyltransferase HypF [Acidimicrobiales bacterium]|nr:carbamoyltransferase HypF [Acidimicrobiales bacterium]